MSQRFARPYAKAILATAGSVERGQTVQAELRLFAEATRALPGILRMASNPALPREVKETVLDEISATLQIGPLTLSLLQLLMRNFRLVHIEAVVEAVDDMLNRRLSVVTAQITTAQPLNADQESRLRTVLENMLQQRVLMSTAANPDLLGGFVARIGSRRYDASLSGQLERLASDLAQQV